MFRLLIQLFVFTGPTRGATDAGYVALAVDSDKIQRKVEFDTKSNDRSENMVEFGKLGLTLLLEVMEEASTSEANDKSSL